jgi:hypothetical protein
MNAFLNLKLSQGEYGELNALPKEDPTNKGGL